MFVSPVLNLIVGIEVFSTDVTETETFVFHKLTVGTEVFSTDETGTETIVAEVGTFVCPDLAVQIEMFSTYVTYVTPKLFTAIVTFSTGNTWTETYVKLDGTFVHLQLVVSTETLSTDATETETFVFLDLFAGIVTFPTYITVAELISAASSTRFSVCLCLLIGPILEGFFVGFFTKLCRLLGSLVRLALAMFSFYISFY